MEELLKSIIEFFVRQYYLADKTLSTPGGRNAFIYGIIIGILLTLVLFDLLVRPVIRFLFSPARRVRRIAISLDKSIREFPSVKEITVVTRSLRKKIQVTVNADTLRVRQVEKEKKKETHKLTKRELKKIRKQKIRQMQTQIKQKGIPEGSVEVTAPSDGRLVYIKDKWVEYLGNVSDSREIEETDFVLQDKVFCNIQTVDKQVIRLAAPVTGYVLIKNRARHVKQGERILLIEQKSVPKSKDRPLAEPAAEEEKP